MSAPDANGWMPIESAPGFAENYDVLLWLPLNANGAGWAMTGTWKSGLWEANSNPSFAGLQPSHWQPLPGAPVT